LQHNPSDVCSRSPALATPARVRPSTHSCDRAAAARCRGCIGSGGGGSRKCSCCGCVSRQHSTGRSTRCIAQTVTPLPTAPPPIVPPSPPKLRGERDNLLQQPRLHQHHRTGTRCIVDATATTTDRCGEVLVTDRLCTMDSATSPRRCPFMLSMARRWSGARFLTGLCTRGCHWFPRLPLAARERRACHWFPHHTCRPSGHTAACGRVHG
jgi:hypothetical protein